MAIKYISEEEELKEKYFKNKEELDAIRSDMTLLKWEILSRAYKLGKDIWGAKFSVKTLAKDMGLPLTTTKRCLSLDKASKKSWDLLKKGQISAFKLAQVCMTKNNGFHDEIVAAVITDDIPTHKIKAFKARSIKDVNAWRHKRAVEKGYARQDTAHHSFNIWIMRGMRMLLMPITSLSKAKRPVIIKDLKRLNKKIAKYVEVAERLTK